MKISVKDQFDLNSSMRGLCLLTMHIYSHIYEYMFYFTFKRSMKSYANDFGNPWQNEFTESEFFKKIDDPYVQNCVSTEQKLIAFKLELMLRFGIDDLEDAENEVIISQAQRFKPYLLLSKRSKSYKRLTLYYERMIAETIDCLYLYACAITAQSYKIPLVLKRQFKFPEQECLKLLNSDDSNVDLLKDLIVDLKKDLNKLRLLIMKKHK